MAQGTCSVFGVLLKRRDQRRDKKPDALLEEAAVVTEVVAVIVAAELIEAASETATLTAHFQDKGAFKKRLLSCVIHLLQDLQTPSLPCNDATNLQQWSERCLLALLPLALPCPGSPCARTTTR